MSDLNDFSGNNYSYYDANLVLPRVSRITSPTQQAHHQHQQDQVVNDSNGESPYSETTSNSNESNEISTININNDSIRSTHHYEEPVDSDLVSVPDVRTKSADQYDDKKPLFIPCPPKNPKPRNNIIRAQVHTKPKQNNLEEKHLFFNKRLPPLKNTDESGTENNICNNNSGNKSLKSLNGHGIENVSTPPKQISTPRIDKSMQMLNDSSTPNLSRDQKLIDRYKDFLNQRFNEDSSSGDEEENDFSISVSSLSSDEGEETNNETIVNKTLTASSFEPLYSLPTKGKNKHTDKVLNKILISNSTINGQSHNRTGSLPDLRSIDNFNLKKVSHVTKNESEAESEPGAKIGYKFTPLPPIPGTSSNINNTGLYETIDGLSKLSKLPKTAEKSNRQDSTKRKTFKDIATILTLVPRLTTNSVRSRKNDHRLADIEQYLPDKKLKIFVGTWNMKGTKFLPSSLDDFLLPPESVYLQDVYVIGTQEGTPFRREWQVRLQETFGPSHVLMQASNFGVLQLSIFVRRELVWFCSSVEQDTIATRVGHKIKTKGALAMSFSIFGTSLLFLTSHFTSNKEKLQERINDYRTICKSIQLPYGDAKHEEADVTDRFDRVFWFGDFNFRIKKPREVVDRMLVKYSKNQEVLIRDLLQHDQLNEIFEKGKIFQGFTESPIHFMPTYKFDVNTNMYDTSSKQRVPSWTDRIVHKSLPSKSATCLHYNSCNSIKVSDHRPVYGIFETVVEPYKDNFTVPGATFNREVYVEANLRRNAPSGSQENSHVCTIV